MKKEIPQGVIIGAIVLVVLLVVGMGWKMLSSDSNPARDQVKPSDIKPDPMPTGSPTRTPISRSGGVGG